MKALSDEALGRQNSSNSGPALPMAPPWTTCCRKRSPWCVKQAAAPSVSAISTFSLVGGMVLHDGKISEMKTGEGKTLVATLPVYLNALAGKGVHVVTVNDYLARRDAEWMGQIYNFLGLSYGVIVHGQDEDTKRPFNTPRTSPTAPTTNSASTTYATT